MKPYSSESLVGRVIEISLSSAGTIMYSNDDSGRGGKLLGDVNVEGGVGRSDAGNLRKGSGCRSTRLDSARRSH